MPCRRCFGKQNFSQLKADPRALFADLEPRIGLERLKPREGGSGEPRASSFTVNHCSQAREYQEPVGSSAAKHGSIPMGKKHPGSVRWLWLVRRAGTGAGTRCVCGDFPLAPLVRAGNSRDAQQVPSAAAGRSWAQAERPARSRVEANGGA